MFVLVCWTLLAYLGLSPNVCCFNIATAVNVQIFAAFITTSWLTFEILTDVVAKAEVKTKKIKA